MTYGAAFLRLSELIQEVIVLAHKFVQAEINYPHVLPNLSLLDQDVLGLQVQMVDAPYLGVVEGIEDVPDDPRHRFVSDVLLLDNTIEVFSSLYIVRYNKGRAVLDNPLSYGHNIRVGDDFHLLQVVSEELRLHLREL